MTDIDTALAASRDAVDEMIRAGLQSGAAWNAASRSLGAPNWTPVVESGTLPCTHVTSGSKRW